MSSRDEKASWYQEDGGLLNEDRDRARKDIVLTRKDDGLFAEAIVLLRQVGVLLVRIADGDAMTKKRAPKSKAAPADEELYDLPPAAANIPAVPPAFANVVPNLRGVKPRAAEIEAMKGAVEELRALTEYGVLFGRTAPSHDVVVRSFERAASWSTMRIAIEKWDRYCRAREERSWRDARKHMARLRPAYKLLSQQGDETSTALTRTGRLLSAMSEIAQRGVSSRKANQQALAEGKAPVRGKQAKRARRAAERAALAAAQTSKPKH
jgi:hypothetical protein